MTYPSMICCTPGSRRNWYRNAQKPMNSNSTSENQNLSDDRFIHFGGPVDSVCVSLRAFGESLDPDEVTKLLKCCPTSVRYRGQVIPGDRLQRIAKEGSWLLEGPPPSDTELDKQVDELLDQVTDDLSVWKYLTDRFYVDVFCGLFLDCFNRGVILSPELIQRLAERRLKINLDIYAADDWPSELEKGLDGNE